MITKAQLITNLKKEAQKNLLLTMKNREFLISSASLLPEKILKNLLKNLKDQNKKTEKYIEIAINNNPNLAMEMKSKSRVIKQKISELQENEEKSNIEKNIDEELQKL